MSKVFNVNADCKPALHYMVDLSSRLEAIKAMIDQGQYFTINRARQYGKTTILRALSQFLKKDYVVLSLDFQLMSYSDFSGETVFVRALAREIVKRAKREEQLPDDFLEKLREIIREDNKRLGLAELFEYLSDWCAASEKPVVLIIDEVDSASNNQIFLDFLALLRGYYIDRDVVPTFQSVILAGVYDIKNLKQKFSAEGQHRSNSPWNIAADFLVELSFSVEDITGMLNEYEKDHHTGMDVLGTASLLYDYTSGYPYLVSRLCKLMDERIAGNAGFPDKASAWSKAGFLEAVKILLEEPNMLFESLFNKLETYPELERMLRDLLFRGKEILYSSGIRSVDMALMFGFVKKINHMIVIANRIFEMKLYNLFLSVPAMQQEAIYDASLKDKNQFIREGRLDMERVLESFVKHFDDIYGDRGEKFLEDDGRRYFLLYLRPIINGAGNYYIESQTRNMERTDVIVDYGGEQFIIELKIWHGDAYNLRGEKQLADYLEHYHLKKGYMLSFNFNKNKQIGMRKIFLDDKLLIEAVV